MLLGVKKVVLVPLTKVQSFCDNSYSIEQKKLCQEIICCFRYSPQGVKKTVLVPLTKVRSFCDNSYSIEQKIMQGNNLMF